MAARNPQVRSLSATAAAESRHHGVVSNETGAALAEARLADYIQRVVEGAPLLSSEQRDRLVLLLRGDAA